MSQTLWEVSTMAGFVEALTEFRARFFREWLPAPYTMMQAVTQKDMDTIPELRVPGTIRRYMMQRFIEEFVVWEMNQRGAD